MKSLRLLCCFDKFKGTLTSKQAGEAVVSGYLENKESIPLEINAQILSLSDGGDGFSSSLESALSLEKVKVRVTGPLGEEIDSFYYKKDEVAVVEMASASGLVLVPKEKRSPFYTTSKGTGDLILHSVKNGAKKVLLGVGGSATTDGGLGCLSALGVKVYLEGEREERKVVFGKDLRKVSRIEIPRDILEQVELEIACDVTNPFLGEKGSVYTYSIQKGAMKEDLPILEEGMAHICEILEKATGKDVSNLPSAGAAGGITGGLFAALKNVKIKRGIEVGWYLSFSPSPSLTFLLLIKVAEAVDLENKIKNCDICLTGEGSFDLQTLEDGKLVSYVVELCEKHAIPCFIFCGIKRDVPINFKHQVYDLVSTFGEKDSINDSFKCLKKLSLEFLKNIDTHLKKSFV